jgi:hypothetical protein
MDTFNELNDLKNERRSEISKEQADRKVNIVEKKSLKSYIYPDKFSQISQDIQNAGDSNRGHDGGFCVHVLQITEHRHQSEHNARRAL